MNYANPNLTLEVIAEGIGMSVRWMTEVFRTGYGVTISEEIRKCRIEKAQELLESGETVSLTAQKAGFSNMRTFERVFKKQVGKSPAKYRRQIHPEKGDKSYDTFKLSDSAEK